MVKRKRKEGIMSKDHCGSAGRVRRAPALPEPPPRPSDLTSYCLMCSHYFFGQDLARCPRCQSPIFRWSPFEDLRLLQTRGTLGNL